jgi:hypothetical protein
MHVVGLRPSFNIEECTTGLALHLSSRSFFLGPKSVDGSVYAVRKIAFFDELSEL